MADGRGPMAAGYNFTIILVSPNERSLVFESNYWYVDCTGNGIR